MNRTGRRSSAAVIQARMSSKRLPGKVLADICGTPVLRLIIDRLREAVHVSEIIVATSDSPEDDPVAALAAAAGVPVVRGPLEDVLERFRLAAATTSCDTIVRITADCPLVDPDVVDDMIARRAKGDFDYVANVFEPRTYPDGLDVEVVSVRALQEAAMRATGPSDREHVTLYIRARPDRFPRERVNMNPDFGHVRVTLDTPDDLERIRRIVANAGPDVRMRGIISAIGAQPRAPMDPGAAK